MGNVIPLALFLKSYVIHIKHILAIFATLGNQLLLESFSNHTAYVNSCTRREMSCSVRKLWLKCRGADDFSHYDRACELIRIHPDLQTFHGINKADRHKYCTD